MPGRSSKKKSAQKKQAPARYVVPPMSPVVTRSGSRVADDNINNSATPTSLGPVISDDSVFIQSAVSQELKTMEAKWDTRFTRMEDNMRSALCNQSVNKLPYAASLPSPPLTTASAAGPTITTVESSSTSSARPGRASRGSSKSSRSPSSSLDSSTRSSSGHSSSRSKKRHRRCRRSRNRSRSRSAARDRRRKQGKYTSLKYLPGFTQVSSYERLVLANVRMALRFYKKDRDIKGILDHIILLAEKAEPGVFESDALIRYDESVKQEAYEHGLDQFKKLDPAAIVKHLSYDGTKSAANSRRASGKRFNSFNKAPAAPSSGNSGNPGPCYKFNFASGGCRRPRCDYKHVCSACFRPGHVNNDCQNVDRPSDGSQK